MASSLSKIFKAYDVRGAYPDELDESIAAKISAAFVKHLKANVVLVGRDMRLSSLALRDSFVNGAISVGAKVVDMGLCSTPMFYFVAKNYPAAAMITASHNPANYNGLKLCGKNAISISKDSGLEDIKKLAAGMDNIRSIDPKEVKSKRKEIDCLQEYISFLLPFVKIKRELKVVIDAGNGMAGYVLPPLLDQIPRLKAKRLYFELDGSFPHHDANPLINKNVQDLIDAVIDDGADVGIAFDGDADRAIFVCEKGIVVRADIIAALLAGEVLKSKPGAAILFDLRSSRVVRQVIEGSGGVAVMTRVGHSFIKEKMREEDAEFASELSGHYYFKDANFTDSGALVMLKTLCMLSGQSKTLSELAMPLMTTALSGEINFRVSDEANIDEIMEKIKGHYSNYSQSKLDGLLVETDEWWLNLRPSNTQPLIRLNIEAKDQGKLEELKKEVVSLLGSCGAELA